MPLDDRDDDVSIQLGAPGKLADAWIVAAGVGVHRHGEQDRLAFAAIHRHRQHAPCVWSERGRGAHRGPPIVMSERNWLRS